MHGLLVLHYACMYSKWRRFSRLDHFGWTGPDFGSQSWSARTKFRRLNNIIVWSDRTTFCPGPNFCNNSLSWKWPESYKGEWATLKTMRLGCIYTIGFSVLHCARSYRKSHRFSRPNHFCPDRIFRSERRVYRFTWLHKQWHAYFLIWFKSGLICYN